MVRREWLHFGMLFLGFVLFFPATLSGLAAVEYEIALEETATDGGEVSEEMDRYGVARYDGLSSEHRRIVDGAVEGERYRFDDDETVAIAWGDGRVVSRDGQYHVIPRETNVDWTSTNGLLALAFGVGGVALIVESIRRHHFPRYRPFRR